MLLRINHFASRIRLRIKQSKILLNDVFSLFIEYHAPLSVTWQISLLNLLLASNGNLTHSLLKLPPSWGSLLYATFRYPQLMTIWKVISGGWGCVCLCGCGCMCGGVVQNIATKSHKGKRNHHHKSKYRNYMLAPWCPLGEPTRF